MHLRRNWRFAALALVSEVVYLAATLALPWWRHGGSTTSWRSILDDSSWAGAVLDREALAICFLGVALLTAVYLLGWRSVRAQQPPEWMVWASALLFSGTLFWLQPITADLFTYLGQAHLLTDLGESPFRPAPIAALSDPILSAYSHNYAGHPSVYGPAWVLLSAVATGGRHDVVTGILYLKGVALLGYLSCGWLIHRILKRTRARDAACGLYLFAWNPLVLFMAPGDGHNDIVMMSAVLLSLWLILGRRWSLAWGALALSVWIKFVSVVAVPFVLLHQIRIHRSSHEPGGLGMVLGGAACVLLVTTAALAPFGDPSWLLSSLRRLSAPGNWEAVAPQQAALGLGLGALLLCLAAAVVLWRFIHGEQGFHELLDAAFGVTLLTFILGAARAQPWHLIWPAALAGLSPRRWAWPVVVALGTVLLAVQLWVEWGAPGWIQ